MLVLLILSSVGCHKSLATVGSYKDPDLLFKQMNDTHPAGPDHVGQSQIYGLADLSFSAFSSHLPKNLRNLAHTGRPKGVSHAKKTATAVDDMGAV